MAASLRLPKADREERRLVRSIAMFVLAASRKPQSEWSNHRHRRFDDMAEAAALKGQTCRSMDLKGAAIPQRALNARVG